jgi:hypothetical protein
MFEIIQKRMFDLALAAGALLLATPPLVLVAILIKLDSPGPIFFVAASAWWVPAIDPRFHRRIGSAQRGGRPLDRFDIALQLSAVGRIGRIRSPWRGSLRSRLRANLRRIDVADILEHSMGFGAVRRKKTEMMLGHNRHHCLSISSYPSYPTHAARAILIAGQP